MEKSKNINGILIVYVCLFIYTSICRQFLFLGFFDLRYLTLIIGFLLVITGCLNSIIKKKIYVQYKNIFLCIYILLILLCNIMWKFNHIQINAEGFRKLLILQIFNICGFIVAMMYSRYISSQFIWKVILFSCVVLAISMVLVYLGIPIGSIWGTGRKGANIIEDSTNLTRNIFQQNIRVAGYAEDPNYATLFLIFGIASLLYVDGLKKYQRILIGIIFCISIALAYSNTVFIALIVSVLVMAIISKINKSEYFVFLLFYSVLSILVFLLPLVEIGNTLTTLSSRYAMWKNAFALFKRSMFLGNGLTSFRSIHLWYVHCHSTYWSILSESGIFAFLSLMVYLYLTSIKIKKKGIQYLHIFYCIFCMMFDMTYMQITVVILCLLPEVYRNEQSERTSLIYN